jgi:isoprenylcysteine carboxyl methyltransferase (ICMT) family protein YpbQ
VTRFWFKPKSYGYGATPVTWEGWAVVVAHVAVVLSCIAVLAVRDQTFFTWLSTIALIIVATSVMVLVSLQKTDGNWRWRWGDSKDSRKAS